MVNLNLFSRPKAGIAEAGIGLVCLPSETHGKKVDEAPQSISLQQKYNNAYDNFPLVAATVDITCEQVVQKYHFEGPNSESLQKWCDKFNQGDAFYRICKSMLRNGNCWIEYPKKGGKMVEQKILDPKWMVTYRTKTGEVIGHAQVIDGMTKVLWGTTGDGTKDSGFKKRRKLADVVHFKFNALNSDKYGTSLIHPCLAMLDVKDRVESDLKTIVRRYAAPIIHAQVGDEMHPPSADDMSSAENTLEDIYADTEYVTSYLVKLTTLEFKGKGLDVGPIIQHVDNQIVTGLQTPLVLLGRGEGTDRAVAEVQLRSFGRHIKSIQRQIKIQFEDKVIVGQGLGGKNDKLIWDFAEEREKVEEIDLIRGLKKDGIITAQKANELLPPKYEEKLPEHLVNPQMGMGFGNEQTGKAPGQQNQYQYQQGPNSIKDNANDPTKVRKEKTTGDTKQK